MAWNNYMLRWFSPHRSQSDWSFHRWRLMASRGWEATTSRSRRASKDHLRTSALHSRPLKARPRAPTCSPARRRYRYERTQAGQRSASWPADNPTGLYPLACCPDSGGKHRRCLPIQKKIVIIFTRLMAARDISVFVGAGSLKNGRVVFLDCQAFYYIFHWLVNKYISSTRYMTHIKHNSQNKIRNISRKGISSKSFFMGRILIF